MTTTEYQRTRTRRTEQPAGGVGGAEARRLMEEAKSLYLRRFPQVKGDDLIVDAVLGAALASRYDAPPVWLIDVTRPSGGKTTALEPLYDIPGSHFESSFAEKVFTSGLGRKDAYDGKEPSLLEKFKENDTRLLIVKDFGSIQQLRTDKKKDLLQMLRELYDRDYRKSHASGKVIEWRRYLGILGASTPDIDRDYMLVAVLGQRFIYYRRARATVDVDEEMAYHALTGDTVPEDVRYELQYAFLEALNAASNPLDVDILPPQVEKMKDAALAAARWRTPVARYRGDVVYTPDPEGPGRISRAFKLLAQSVAALYGKTAVGPHEVRLVQRVARDSMPQRRADILDALSSRPEGTTLAVLHGLLEPFGYSSRTIEDDLKDLSISTIGVIERIGSGRGKTTRWRVIDRFSKPLVAWRGGVQ